jgi:hypothetical protein
MQEQIAEELRRLDNGNGEALPISYKLPSGDAVDCEQAIFPE